MNDKSDQIVNRSIKNKQNYTLKGTEAMIFTPKRSADHPYHFDIWSPRPPGRATHEDVTFPSRYSS
jgi:hypothetical protein